LQRPHRQKDQAAQCNAIYRAPPMLSLSMGGRLRQGQFINHLLKFLCTCLFPGLIGVYRPDGIFTFDHRWWA
jgi:hypothetical protein